MTVGAFNTVAASLKPLYEKVTQFTNLMQDGTCTTT